MVHLAGLERIEVAAHLRYAPIGRFGSGLVRIVVADIDGLSLDLAAVDFEHLVLQNGGVVVQVPLEDRPSGISTSFAVTSMLPRFASSGSAPGPAMPFLVAQAAAVRLRPSRKLTETFRLVRKLMSSIPLADGCQPSTAEANDSEQRKHCFASANTPEVQLLTYFTSTQARSQELTKNREKQRKNVALVYACACLGNTIRARPGDHTKPEA